MTANVTIFTLDKQGVLSVPSRALRFTPEIPLIEKEDIVNDCEGTHKVWTKEGNTFTAHPVTIGISNGMKTEIISGITEGIQVISEANIGNSSANGQPEMNANSEKSPFMPGPPGSNKKK